ncbi:MAG: hypothetical protein IPG45_28245 [Deltaproteobacteria bacterium]|nr:hypothetical protein [Deltaproteobacteria bacterium]
MPERLTESLVRRGKLDPGQAKEAHRRHLLLGGALDSALFELQLVSESDVLDAMAAAYGLSTLSARQAAAGSEDRALRAFPEQWAKKHLLVPLSISPDGGTLTVLSPAPVDINLLARLSELLELAVKPVLAPEVRVFQRLQQLYGAPLPDRYRTLIDRLPGPTVEAPQPPPAAEAPPPPPPTPPRTAVTVEEKPLTFGEAVARLREADDRDEIIRIALLYAAKDLSFVAMFINHEQTLEGRQALGSASDKIPGLTIPLTNDSAFKVVVETHAHYLGPLPTDPVHAEFLAKLGREAPRAVLIAPVRIRNRTVALLYGENGALAVQPRLAADLMLFITHVQLALEAVVRRRKNSSLTGAPPPGAPTRSSAASGLPAPTPMPAPTTPPRPLARLQTLSLRPPPPAAPPVLSTLPAPVEPEPVTRSSDLPRLRASTIPATLVSEDQAPSQDLVATPEPTPLPEVELTPFPDSLIAETPSEPPPPMPEPEPLSPPEPPEPPLALLPLLPPPPASSLAQADTLLSVTRLDPDPEPEIGPTDPTARIRITTAMAALGRSPPEPKEEEDEEGDDDWEPVDVAAGPADPTTPIDAQALSAALAGPIAGPMEEPPPPEEKKTGLFRLDGQIFEPGAFERAVLAEHGGSTLLDELDELAALTHAPTPAPEEALRLDHSPLLRPPPANAGKPMLAVVAEDDPPMMPTPAPPVSLKPILAVIPEPEGPTSQDDAEWETGPLPRISESAVSDHLRRSIAEDSTVPDLSAEAWIRASSEVTRPRPIPAEVRDRANLPQPPEDPVPLTRLSSTARMSALSPLLPFPPEEPVPLIHRSNIVRAEAPAPPPTALEAEPGHHQQGVDASGRIVAMNSKPPTPAVDPLEGWLEQLVDPDPARREAAVQVLAKEPSEILARALRHFPGVLALDPFGPVGPLPPPSQLSALLSLCERFGREAHPHLQRRLDVADPTQRFVATYFYTAVSVPEAIPRLIQRLHDEEPRICMLAARTLFSYREHPDFALVLDHLHGRLDATSSAARRHAAYLIGLFRDVTAIPRLIDVFEKKDRALIDVAEDALAEITKQRFGANAKKWRAWWQKNQSRSRIAWLVEGLSAKEPELRKSAAEELRAVTGLDLGYDDDAPRRQREDARLRWVAWWQEQEGRGNPTVRA